jgi:hypothetical protein
MSARPNIIVLVLVLVLESGTLVLQYALRRVDDQPGCVERTAFSS